MIRLNDFGLSIVPAEGQAQHFTRGAAHYVSIPDGVEYRIRLTNDRPTRADAEVTVDGKAIGGFAIPPYDSIEIERPTGVAKKLTFFAESNREATRAGVVRGAYENGVVSVSYKPQVPIRYTRLDQSALESPRLFGGLERPTAMGMAASASASSLRMRGAGADSAKRFAPESTPTSGSGELEGGATLLGDESQQRFITVPSLRSDQIDWNNLTEITLRLVARRDARRTPVPPPFVYYDSVPDGMR